MSGSGSKIIGRIFKAVNRQIAAWHGFYELKKKCMQIQAQADELFKSGKPAKVFKVKATGGKITKPAELIEYINAEENHRFSRHNIDAY